MSGVKRIINCHTIKLRDIVIQNSDNTFPEAGGVLYAGNDKGQLVVNRNLSISQLLINDVPSIDGSGNIAARTLALTADASGNSIQAAGDMYVNDSNIYAGDDTNSAGLVQTTSLQLADLSNNSLTGVYAYKNNLFWQGPSSALNISQSIRNLRIPPGYNTFRELRNPDMRAETPLLDPFIVPTLNRILRLFNSRKIFIALA
jgi:hypothetical protein